MRVTVSLGPPAANGTMIVIGRDGEECAVAVAANSKVMAMVNDPSNQVTDLHGRVYPHRNSDCLARCRGRQLIATLDAP